MCMDKEKITISVDPVLISHVKELQMRLAGCCNVSSLIEILLRNWVGEFGGVNYGQE